MSANICQDIMDAVATVVQIGEEFDIADIADLVKNHPPTYISRTIAKLSCGSDPALRRVRRGRYAHIKTRVYLAGNAEPRPRKAVRDTEPCPVCFWVPSLSGKCGCD